jgi:hypothetical protein
MKFNLVTLQSNLGEQYTKGLISCVFQPYAVFRVNELMFFWSVCKPEQLHAPGDMKIFGRFNDWLNVYDVNFTKFSKFSPDSLVLDDDAITSFLYSFVRTSDMPYITDSIEIFLREYRPDLLNP